MADYVAYDDIYENKGGWGETRSNLVDARESAMDWADLYYTEPETIDLVSSRIESLLDPTSEYMLAAQADSKQAAEERGYLDSGFNEGAGTVAAIDKVMEVASKDAYTDAYNTSYKNAYTSDVYSQAVAYASEAQQFQGELDLSSYAYVQDSDIQAIDYSNYLELMDEYQTDSLELIDVEHQNSLEIMDELYKNQLAILDQESGYKISNIGFQYSYLQDYLDEVQDAYKDYKSTEFSYKMELQDAAHEDDLSRLYLKSANDVANRTLRDQSGLQAYYISGYADIMGADIQQESKYDLLVGLGENITAATNAAYDRGDTRVGDNPYSVTFDDYYTPYDQGDPTSSIFRWDMGDASHVWKKASEVISEIDTEIHNQTNHQERNYYPPYQQLEVIRDEFPQLRYSNPEEWMNIMEWYDREGKASWDNWEDNIKLWSDLTRTANGYYANRASNQTWDMDYGIKYPTSYKGTVWNSDTQQIEKPIIQVPGNDAYYQQVYSNYERSLYDDSGYVSPTPPAGYVEAKAACSASGGYWGDGACHDNWDWNWGY